MFKSPHTHADTQKHEQNVVVRSFKTSRFRLHCIVIINNKNLSKEVNVVFL